MFKVALKSLLSHKLRMLLTTTAIVLGVAFVSGTYIFTDSIGKTFNNLFDDVYSGIDLTVRSTDPVELSPSFDEKYVNVIKNTEGVKTAEASIDSIYTQLISKDGKPIGGNGPPTLGFSWTNDPELNVLFLKEGNGRPPQSAGEIVIDVNTASQNDFAIGDMIKVQTLGPVQEFKIVGLASFGESDSLAGATLAAFEYEQAQELFDMDNKVSEVSLKVDSGVDVDTVRSSLQSALPADLEIVTGDEQSKEQTDDLNQGLGFINIGLLAFAGIALFVGAYIIQNTYRIIVAQRSKELALLRAIGATRKQIVATVVYEAFLVGLFASIVGILVGFGVANGIRAIGNSFGFGLPDGDFEVFPRTIIVSLAVGVVVTVLSALIPAIKASRTSPVEGLRDMESNASGKSLRRRSILSLAVAVLGGGVMLYGLSGNDLTPSPVYYVGFGVGAIFLGVSSFAPALSSPLGRLIGWPFARFMGMPAKIAQLNVGRTPRRTASTASALMIGVALVSLVTIFASSVNATIEEVISESFPADVIALPNDTTNPFAVIPAKFGEELKELPELKSVSALKYNLAEVDGEKNTFVGAIDPETFGDVIKINPTPEFTELNTDSGVFVYEDDFYHKNLKLGDQVEIKFSDNRILKPTVVGTYSEPFDTPYIISRTLYASVFDDNNTDTFVSALYANPNDSESARKAVDKVAERYPAVNVQDQSELVQQTKDQINQILGLIWSLLGFAVFIAVLGITNTLALSIVERKHELGLLRAVGMSKRQIRSMVRVESVIISLFGAILGVLMGTFFAWALLRSLQDEGLTAFEVPLTSVVVLFVLATFAGIVASIWPAWQAARVNILDAIKFE